MIYLIKLRFNNEKDEILPAEALSLVEEKQVPIKSDCEQMVAGNSEEKHAGPGSRGCGRGRVRKGRFFAWILL